MTLFEGEEDQIKWPGNARMAIALAGNLEAWTEIPNPKHRRTHHVGGSNPIKEDDVSRLRLPDGKRERLWGERESGAFFGSWTNTG